MKRKTPRWIELCFGPDGVPIHVTALYWLRASAVIILGVWLLTLLLENVIFPLFSLAHYFGLSFLAEMWPLSGLFIVVLPFVILLMVYHQYQKKKTEEKLEEYLEHELERRYPTGESKKGRKSKTR